MYMYMQVRRIQYCSYFEKELEWISLIDQVCRLF